MPVENPEESEMKRVILRPRSPPMPTFLLLLLVTLRSIILSRVDLQLENLDPAPSNRRPATFGGTSARKARLIVSFGFLCRAYGAVGARR